MAKLKLAIGADAASVDATQGFDVYDGPVPPPGMYKGKIKSIKVQESQSKKPMLRVISELTYPSQGDPKHQYNGCPLYEYLVIPQSKNEEHYALQVGNINQMLDAIAGTNKVEQQKLRTVFWNGEAVLDAKGEKIVKIGKFSLLLKDGKGGLPVNFALKRETFKKKGKNGEMTSSESARINAFFPFKDKAAEAEPETDEPDEDLDVVDDDDENKTGIVDDSEYDNEAFVDDDPEPEPEEDPEEDPEPETEDPEENPEPEVDEGLEAEKSEMIAEEVPEEETPAKAPRRRRERSF